MASKDKTYPCACEYQVVWFYEKPTIIVCENCERVYHHGITICPTCGEAVSYYVKENEL